MGFENEGKSWDLKGFQEWVATQNVSWAEGVVLHHSWNPALADRPNGWEREHMRNIRHFYEKTKGWSAGPHLFVDEHRVWGMSSIEKRGVHMRGKNATYIGIEVLGNYDKDDPTTGRGLGCWTMAAEVADAIFEVAGWDDYLFHRDGSWKTCPGEKVTKEFFNKLLERAGVNIAEEVPAAEKVDIANLLRIFSERTSSLDWQVRQMKKEIERAKKQLEA